MGHIVPQLKLGVIGYTLLEYLPFLVVNKLIMGKGIHF